jgi:hypothetical protein
MQLPASFITSSQKKLNAKDKSVTQQGGWSFEVKILQTCKCCIQVKQIFCRKTPEYGQVYCACAVITIVDNEPCIDLLLNKGTDSFTKKDYLDFSRYLTSIGFENVSFKRMRSGKTRSETRTSKVTMENLL